MRIIEAKDNEEHEEVQLLQFPPGSVLVLKVMPHDHSLAAVQRLRAMLQADGLPASLEELSLVDLNVLLYRCSAEEYATTGDKAYHLANYGDLVYCGLQVLQELVIKMFQYF